MLQAYQLAPETVLAVAGITVALATLLYLLLDAFSYKRIPELSVPLKSGACPLAHAERSLAVLALTFAY